MKKYFLAAIWSMILFVACNPETNPEKLDTLTNNDGQKVYQDIPFLQDYSVKYYLPKNKRIDFQLSQIASDRNENIQIISGNKLQFPYNGHFLAPGEILPERTYRYMIDKNINGIISYQNQFVYSGDKAIFSNAWAGKLFLAHGLNKPKLFAGGSNFDFLISDQEKIVYINQEGKKIWKEKLAHIISIEYNKAAKNFIVLTKDGVSIFNPDLQKLKEVYHGKDITCASIFKNGTKIIIGTNNGIQWLNANGEPEGKLQTNLPWKEITAMEEINGSLWIGSTKGAFRLNEENKYDYYASQRWIPDNHVVDLKSGPEGSVLILTKKGLGQICYKKMTLYDKANMLEKITRKHFIRYGFSSTGHGMENGNMGELTIYDSDNDGLWTGMYLGGQLFRYAATKDPEAWENCKEALMGFERLYSITGVPGLPARAYEVRGYESSGYTNAFSEKTRHLFEESGYDVQNSPWRNGTDKGWVWKSTTSSDEVVGHFFALSLFADLADDIEWKNRAKKLVVGLAEHIYANDLYLIDWNGKPTTWGKWNPDYVNNYPPSVGDRKLTSSNIIAFLQAGFHFTKDEKYKNKIFELINKHGYLDNLMKPMNEIGKVGNSDDEKIESWAEMLSNEWNHSDDEMYFLGYWSLYPYALNDELKLKYSEAIRDHWNMERPEKDPLWNFTYAMTGAKQFDLEESIWWLKKHPIDHISWRIENSYRKDLVRLPKNFRNQFTREVISPAEARADKHAGNRFTLDNFGNGSGAQTPGDIWLLPYWMGRYLGVISAPVQETD